MEQSKQGGNMPGTQEKKAGENSGQNQQGNAQNQQSAGKDKGFTPSSSSLGSKHEGQNSDVNEGQQPDIDQKNSGQKNSDQKNSGSNFTSQAKSGEPHSGSVPRKDNADQDRNSGDQGQNKDHQGSQNKDHQSGQKGGNDYGKSGGQR